MSAHRDSRHWRSWCRVSASIDWIELRVRLARPSQFQYVQRCIHREIGSIIYVSPVDDGPGGTTAEFLLRFNDDDANAAILRQALAAVDREFQLTAEPAVEAIEIACDFWPKPDAPRRTRVLVEVTRLLQGRLFAPEAEHPRRFHQGKRIIDLRRPGERLKAARTLWLGNRSDPLFWRVYAKRTDRDQPLAPSAWRARVEVVLQHGAPARHGLLSVADLEAFDFRSLTSLFRFRRQVSIEAKARGDRFVSLALNELCRRSDATELRGTHSFSALGRRTRHRKTRKESSFLEPDEVLQGAVSDALRRLSAGGPRAEFSVRTSR
ncbi:MAG: hypothetical protein U1F54_18805 [Burkholderiales bacterium]